MRIELRTLSIAMTQQECPEISCFPIMCGPSGASMCVWLLLAGLVAPAAQIQLVLDGMWKVASSI